ncbi:MAG TPA: hypothetical protein PLH72_02670 [Vicinamibacterales bacterium]|jgi:hypothetical protein|nr:hypothetical protein [Vicinamibacterales bacterium]
MARCAVETCGRWCPDLLVNRGIGARVDDEWFCSRACIERMARERLAGTPRGAAGLPAVPHVRLGALLTAQGSCDAATLAEALVAQRQSHRRLGEQLLAMGAADAGTVLRALATQFNARCLPTFDATTVRQAPGGLSPDAVRALGLAPISDPVEGRVRVACPAPVPRRALGAFRQLTGWTPEVYLVSDEDWAAILSNYGADTGDTTPAPQSEFVRTTSLTDAAARIAAAAARGRRTTVTEARWDDYAWVRVQGPGLVEDVCLALADARTTTEEAPWPAATTSR